MTAAPVLERPAAAPTLERRSSDWERHEGHGGPKVLPPPGVEWRSASGKTKQKHRYYTRVTTLAKAIDDTSKLMAWKMRGVLVGLGQRPAYVVAAAGLTLRPEDRKEADELAEKALQAAKGDDAALVGTALHTFTERLDRGEDLGHVPDQLRPLLEAYRQLTAPLTFHHREVRMVCDDLEAAGTPDALGTCSIPDPDGVVDGLRVIDLKSGKVAYPGPMSIQLATYGRSDLYDPATGERTPVELNQRWGLIVHVQQDGEVPPGLYWLNLQHGNDGVDLCRLVRSWRKVKPQAILVPVEGAAAPDAVDALQVEDTVVVEQEQDPEPAELPVRHNDGPVPTGPYVHVTDELPAGAILSPANSTAVEPAGELTPATVPSEQEPACRWAHGEVRDLDDRGRCAVCAAGDEDDEAAQDGTDDPTEPWEAARAAVRSAVTTADLDLLWRQGGAEWPADLVELATARHGELQRAEQLARPRAALAAAIRTGSAQDLHKLWTTHGQGDVWTEQHARLAQARYDELRAAGAA